MKVQTSRHFLAKLAARRSFRSMFLVPLASGVLLSLHNATANTADNVINGQSDLTAAATYSGGLPTTASDVTFTNVTYAPTAFTLNTTGTNLSIGTLDDLDATQALTVQNATVGNTSTITLNGGTNSVAPAAGDLLYVATGGTLNITSATTTGTLGLALAASGTFDIAGTSTISSIISGTGFGFEKTGAGTLNITGANTYTGGTTLTAGAVSLATGATATSTASLGAAGSTVTLNGGTLQNGAAAGGTAVANNNFVVNASSTVNMGNRLNFGAAGRTTTINNGATLTFTAGTTVTRDNIYSAFANGTGGTGNVIINGSGGVQLLTVGGAFNGFTGLNLTINGSANLQAVTNSSGNTYNIGSLSGTSTTAVLSGANNGGGSPIYSIGALGITTSYAGTITGNSTLVKVGTGMLTLSGANTYTGTTTVNGGMLALTSTGTLGTGNVILADAAGVNLTLANTTSIADSATLTFGLNSTIVLNGTGSETLGAVIDSTSGVVLNTPGTYTAAQLNANFGVTSFSGNEMFTITGVPEPSVIGLLLAGGLAGGVLLCRRRAADRVGIQQA